MMMRRPWGRRRSGRGRFGLAALAEAPPLLPVPRPSQPPSLTKEGVEAIEAYSASLKRLDLDRVRGAATGPQGRYELIPEARPIGPPLDAGVLAADAGEEPPLSGLSFLQRARREQPALGLLAGVGRDLVRGAYGSVGQEPPRAFRSTQPPTGFETAGEMLAGLVPFPPKEGAGALELATLPLFGGVGAAGVSAGRLAALRAAAPGAAGRMAAADLAAGTRGIRALTAAPEMRGAARGLGRLLPAGEDIPLEGGAGKTPRRPSLDTALREFEASLAAEAQQEIVKKGKAAYVQAGLRQAREDFKGTGFGLDEKSIRRELGREFDKLLPGGAAGGGRVPPVRPPAAAGGGGQDALGRLVAAIKGAKPARAETEALRHEVRAKQAGELAGVFAKGRGEAGVPEALGKLKGTLPKVDVEPVRPQFTPDDILELSRQIDFSQDIPSFTKLNTHRAFTNLLNGELPTKSELKLLDVVFGEKLTQAILGKEPLSKRAWREFVELAGLPRATLSTADFSATYRQGGVLVPGNAKEAGGAFVAAVKAAFSERNFQAIEQSIRANRFYSQAVESGLYIARRSAIATEREEAWVSRLLHQIPVLGQVAKGSERHYVGYLNKLRMDVFAKYAEQYGANLTSEAGQNLAGFINAATGRGSLGRLSSLGPEMATVFFSPRLMVSRFQAPLYLASKTPAARAAAAKNLTAFFGLGVAHLALAKMAGADVEIDPRSSDFGKVKIGSTRYELWAGYQPIARNVVQIMLSERKTTGGGDIIEAERLSMAGRFIASKFSPAAGFAMDVLRGAGFLGEEVPPRTKEATLDLLFQRFVPLSIQDIVDAIEAEGPLGGLFGVPAGLGGGVVTIRTVRDLQNKEAQKLGADSFDALTGDQKRAVNSLPAIQKERDRTASEGYKEWRETMQALNDDPQSRHDPAWYRNQVENANIKRYAQNADYRRSVKSYGAENANERALNQFYEVFAKTDEQFAGVRSDAYYDAIEQKVASLETKWTPEQKSFVRERETQDVPGDLNKGYVDAKQRLRDSGYWDILDSIPLYKSSPQIAALYDEWVKRGASEEAMRAAVPDSPLLDPYIRKIMKTIEKQVKDARKAMLDDDPDLDVALVRYYGRAPVTDEGRLMRALLLQAQEKQRRAG